VAALADSVVAVSDATIEHFAKLPASERRMSTTIIFMPTTPEWRGRHTGGRCAEPHPCTLRIAYL